MAVSSDISKHMLSFISNILSANIFLRIFLYEQKLFSVPKKSVEEPGVTANKPAETESLASEFELSRTIFPSV